MRAESGVTLIETLMAVVIVAVAVAGLVQVFGQSLRSSTDPVLRKQLLAVAEEVMDEVLLRPYATASNTAASGCARDTFNDVTDYNGYSTSSKICDIEGNSISMLSGYSLSITVADDTTALSGVTEAKRITVTVSRGSDAVVLRGWRTNYAGP